MTEAKLASILIKKQALRSKTTNKKSLPLWEVFLLVTLKEFEPIGMGLTTSERRAEERRSAIPMSAVDEAQAK